MTGGRLCAYLIEWVNLLIMLDDSALAYLSLRMTKRRMP